MKLTTNIQQRSGAGVAWKAMDLIKLTAEPNVLPVNIVARAIARVNAARKKNTGMTILEEQEVSANHMEEAMIQAVTVEISLIVI